MEKDPWDSVLAATIFAARMAIHMAFQATPTQFAFGRDRILNIPFEMDRQLNRICKQVLIRKNNAHDNMRQIPCTYNVGDKVLVTTDALDKYSNTLYKACTKL